MTIDTILLCFCEDCYQNDGTPEKNKVLHNVIASNAEHAAVSASIIYLNSKQEQREYDMLIKVDKWTLKDLKKAVENIGEHNKAPAMSDHEKVRVDDEFLSLSLSLLTSLPLPPSSYLSLTLSPLLLSVSLSLSPTTHYNRWSSSSGTRRRSRSRLSRRERSRSKESMESTSATFPSSCATAVQPCGRFLMRRCVRASMTMV